jgi:hypothetical protein
MSGIMMSIISRSYKSALKLFKASIGSLTVSTSSKPYLYDMDIQSISGVSGVADDTDVVPYGHS